MYERSISRSSTYDKNNTTTKLLQIVISQETRNVIQIQWAVSWEVMNCYSVDVGVGSEGTYGALAFSVILHCVSNGGEKCK
jgi:hypothetical protein